ncbi:multidrug efflux MFS transporter [Mycobacterium leprae]|uniref:multidrug efflux MFS transporter n=1 Tax=Mycobacterium leprae TaxID=1769 RepID=UPI0002FA2A82|nr:multidrug efflux MFS transporter [Mycobacterium leprae]
MEFTVLDGWLIYTYSWQWIFWINLQIDSTAFFLAALLFQRSIRCYRHRLPL